MGQLVLQPSSIDPRLLSEASLVIFPLRIERKGLSTIVEWAAATQVPIFCRAQDIPTLEEEGFGAYRFLKLEGYREVDFQGGTIEFFPARRRKEGGLKGRLASLADFFGWSPKPNGFHVRIRPKNERPVLFLASPEVDSVEWTLLIRDNPSSIVAFDDVVTDDERGLLEKRFNAKILASSSVGELVTQPLPSTDVSPTKKQIGLWAVNSR
jgi:hypothetical protein